MKKFFSRVFCALGASVFFGLVLSLTVGLYHYTKGKSVPQYAVLSLDLNGALSDGPQTRQFSMPFGKEPLTLFDITSTLDRAAKDTRIKGLFVRLGSIALGIAQIQELRSALHRFRATGKFAVVFSDGFGDMAGGTLPYYLASAFDEIALQPLGGLSFVGLSMEMPFMKRLLDEYGVTPRFAARKEYKDLFTRLTDDYMSPENREAYRALLEGIMSQIIQDVAKERELSQDDIKHLSQEPPLHHGQDIKRRGLVDHVSYFDECKAYALKKAGPNGAFIDFAIYAHRSDLPFDFWKKKKYVALIFAQGFVTHTHSMGLHSLMSKGTISAKELQDIFEALLDDKGEKPSAIVLRVDSPGGESTSSETIWRLIERAKAAKIPVIVSMGNMATSAGYWIACPADKIIAQGATMTGSIGVAGGKFVLEKLWERLGVYWDGVATSPNASSLSPHHDFTPEQWQSFQESLDYTYAYFLKRVAQGRRLTPEKVEAIAKGRVWTGREALAQGLVDAVGDLHDAIEIAKQMAGIEADTPCDTTLYPRRHAWNSLLSNSFEDLAQNSALTRIHAFEKYIGYLQLSMAVR